VYHHVFLVQLPVHVIQNVLAVIYLPIILQAVEQHYVQQLQVMHYV
jgi:hypothetical protein